MLLPRLLTRTPSITQTTIQTAACSRVHLTAATVTANSHPHLSPAHGRTHSHQQRNIQTTTIELSPPKSTSRSTTTDWKTKIQYRDDERKAKAEKERKQIRNEIQSLAGRNHQELYRSGGKPFFTPKELIHPGQAHFIPHEAHFECEMLDGTKISIPEICMNYHATLFVVSFNQQAFDFGTKWVEPFIQLFPQSPTQKDVKCIQLSIISNSLIGTLFGSYMGRRFKAAIPADHHSFISMVKENAFDQSKIPSTFVPAPARTHEEEKADAAAQDAYELAMAVHKTNPSQPAPSPPFKGARRSAMQAEPGWSIQNPVACHVFLIDEMKRVRWRATGPPQDDDLAILERLTKQLVKE